MKEITIKVSDGLYAKIKEKEGNVEKYISSLVSDDVAKNILMVLKYIEIFLEGKKGGKIKIAKWFLNVVKKLLKNLI